jgi:hypothetical protein
MSEVEENALERAILYGRGGLGSIYVWAAGTHTLTHFRTNFCRILSLLKYLPFKIMASSRSFFSSDPSIISLFFSFQVMVG